MKPLRNQAERRRARVRRAIRLNAVGRPRLSVHRSGKHIYAQVIDDAKGHTVAAASTLDASIKGAGQKGADKSAAEKVGALIAERAKAAAGRGFRCIAPPSTSMRR